MNLILGLGNPGPEYELTRHNIGFLVIDNLAEKHGISLDLHQHQALNGRGEISGYPVMISKPLTFMNESGRAARSLMQWLQVDSEQIIVVHDDIDLPLGKIKCKTKGGDAGQRGVGSIMERLSTDQFRRVRVGIGRPENRDDVVDYVLTPFEEEEFPLVNEVIESAVERIEQTLMEMNAKSNKDETEEQAE